MFGALILRMGRWLARTNFAQRFLEGVDAGAGNRMSERGMISHAFEFVRTNQIDGDYFEFGLYRGRTFCHAGRMRRRFGLSRMMLVGFDSFQGLPPVDEVKGNVWAPGEFNCSRAEFETILHRHGLEPDTYHLVEGFYEESLGEATHQALLGRTAAVVYVDCDLYSSTVAVLSFLARYLVTGSTVCFDDFYHYRGSPDEGEQRALREFLSNHREFTFTPSFRYGVTGMSFLVLRTPSGPDVSSTTTVAGV